MSRKGRMYIDLTLTYVVGKLFSVDRRPLDQRSTIKEELKAILLQQISEMRKVFGLTGSSKS